MVVISNADRIALLRTLKAAGPTLLVSIVTVVIVESLVPAGTAVALATVTSRVARASHAALLSVALVPLLMFGLVQLIGHALSAVREPLFYLATARVDGAHRAEIARLAATSRTIGVLERPETQRLIREAKADPENWTEKTPATGALAQLRQLAQGVGLVSSAGILAAYSWWLVPLVAVPSLLARHLSLRMSVRWYHRFRDGLGEGRRAGIWHTALTSPGEGKEIRVFGLGGWVIGRAQRHFDTMFGPVWAAGADSARRQWQQFLLALAPISITYLVVAHAAATGRTSVGIATAVFAASTSVYESFHDDSRVAIGAAACLRASARLRQQLRNAPPGTPNPADTPSRAAPCADGPPLVRFEGVCFGYPGTDRMVLDKLDLQIRPGELLAIVGLNGAGKSTLIKLLATLYEPTAGRITADGVDLAEVDPDGWRRRISIVFQDFVRYHLSAEDNVFLGNASVPPDRAALEAAAGDAGFDHVLPRLPAGWRTPLARSRTAGVDLSGGQWQQVVLARALYAVHTGARLLVLDEPTAHLDVRTEFEVFGRLAAHHGDASVVLISHRLSTVRQADRIVLLSDGRIAESGTHDELMALDGRYAEMFTIQADRFTKGYDDRIEEGDLM